MACILIVDDLVANREFLVTLLRYQGHRLLEAADGSEGLAAVRAEHPDLVITDVLMPVMDGYEFVRQLRLDPATSRIPIVFYTAHYGEREARALALSSGVSDVLTKPAEPEDVLRIVGRALSGEFRPVISADLSPPRIDFDREHLRLLTDKLWATTDDLKAANARLRALINIGLELASERNAERLLQSVCVAARDLFGATYVTLGIVDRNDRRVRRVVASGTEADWISNDEAAPGILGEVVAQRRTVRGDNPGGDPAMLALPAHHPRLQAFLAAPIASPALVYGWICLVSNEGRTFTEDDEHLVMALAGQVGRIYENGYFYAVAQKRADELEHEVLERKQVEVALREARDLAQRYLNTADVMLLALDLRGRITLINRKGCDLLGWTEGELLGRDWIETCLPVRLREGLREKFHSLGGGDLSIVETPVLTKFGEERSIEWRNTLLRNDAGGIIGTFRSGTDTTERHKAEQALEGTEARLAFALQRSHTGGWDLDLRDHTAHRTLEHDRIFGYESLLPEWTYEIFLNHVVAEDRAEVNRLFQQAIAAQTDWAFECRIRRADGEVRWIWAAGGHQRDADGQVRHMAGIVQDIDERKRAVEALRTAEERMRFALQSANVGIWDMNYTSGVLQWSETMEVQYGVPPGTFRGTFEAFVDCIHPDDRQSVLAVVGEAMKSGVDFTTLHRTRWPDGTVHWLSGAGRIHLGADGSPVRGIGVSQDITARRTLEEQYQQAQKMEAIGRLAGGVAHDFNNLLTVILGFCELLLADCDPADPGHADIAEIQKAGLSAAGLTRQLLAFSRRQIIEPTLLDLNVAVADMRGMLGRLIGEDVKVVMALDPGLAAVIADRGQVEQVVLNLAVNARDAMPKGGTLTIETHNVDLDDVYVATHFAAKPGAYVVLTVSDTGTGMTPEVQARLFEPFFTTKEVGKGTGLGLATVHGIMARSGGSINVYSEVGRGASFKVYFPRADGLALAAEAPSPAPQATGDQTILVVEDAEGLRELTCRLLERQGYKVWVAANAEEAVDLFERHAIDLILTDVVMPGVSGPELTKKLVERRPELKIIYMSGYTEEAIVQHGVLKLGIAFLHKPFTSDSLGRKIREVLDR